MATVTRTRTIRPSTRLATSVNYRVNVEKVLAGDMLEVHIMHESKPFKRTFRFEGRQLAGRNNISFKVAETGNTVHITWSGAQPINL